MARSKCLDEWEVSIRCGESSQQNQISLWTIEHTQVDN